MTFIPLEKIASVGVVKSTDGAPARLPPEVWSDGNNVRCCDGVLTPFAGAQEVLNSPLVAPGFIMEVEYLGDAYWLYASAIGVGSKVCMYNSGVHYDISKLGNYEVLNFNQWQGVVFQGIPILNYGTGTPQYWENFISSTKLADLAAWPANTVCARLCAYGSYLIALNITDASGPHPHTVRWSDGADPGTLPISWSTTDATVDAGEQDLTDINSGAILDGLALQDAFVIYKNESTWIMRYIGGQQIMSIKPVKQASGLLAARCVCPVQLAAGRPEAHFLMNGFDLGVFDTNSFKSVADKRARKFLLASIDYHYYANSFVFDNPMQHEAYFCFPESGAQYPTIAAVWNYLDDTLVFRDWHGVSVAKGLLDFAIANTWDSITTTWESSAADRWQESSRQQVVVADIANARFVQLDIGTQFVSTDIATFIERRDLAVIGQDREGNPIVDYNSRKLFSRVWPKVTGAAIDVQIGGAETPQDAVVWGPKFSYDPTGALRYVDCGVVDSLTGNVVPCNTPYMAVRFSSTTSDAWKLEGYGLEVEVISEL